jgi:hypothetical protein
VTTTTQTGIELIHTQILEHEEGYLYEFRVYRSGQVRVNVWTWGDDTGGSGQDMPVDDFVRKYDYDLESLKQAYRRYLKNREFSRKILGDQLEAPRCKVIFPDVRPTEYEPDAQPDAETQPWPTTSLGPVFEQFGASIMETVMAEIHRAGYFAGHFDTRRGTRQQSNRISEGYMLAYNGQATLPAGEGRPFQVDSRSQGETGNRLHRVYVAGTAQGHYSDRCSDCWDHKTRAPGGLCCHWFAAKFAWVAAQYAQKINPATAA